MEFACPYSTFPSVNSYISSIVIFSCNLSFLFKTLSSGISICFPSPTNLINSLFNSSTICLSCPSTCCNNPNISNTSFDMSVILFPSISP